MKKLFLSFVGGFLFLSSAAPAFAQAKIDGAATTTSPAEETAGINPRSKALELAGAFTNDGFKIRDGYNSAIIQPDKPQIIEVNLYAGNQYWFCAAVVAPGKKVDVSIYDENGKKIQAEEYQDDSVAAAGIVAENSGRYFVEVILEEGQKSEYCFLYAYK